VTYSELPLIDSRVEQVKELIEILLIKYVVEIFEDTELIASDCCGRNSNVVEACHVLLA